MYRGIQKTTCTGGSRKLHVQGDPETYMYRGIQKPTCTGGSRKLPNRKTTISVSAVVTKQGIRKGRIVQ